jgi:hypothetical protein
VDESEPSEIEVTPGMIAAGIEAYYAVETYPGEPLLEERLPAAFRAMLLELRRVGA